MKCLTYRHQHLKVLMLLLLGFVLVANAFSQNQQNSLKVEIAARLDSTVFLNPLVKNTFIDATGRQVVEVSVPGVKPGIHTTAVAEPTDGSVLLNNVPAYDWSFGCMATAAAMMAGYYDLTGYPDMYTGQTNGGNAPMTNSVWGTVSINGETLKQCPLSATRKNLDGRATKGHVDDFWVQSGSAAPDPYIGNWSPHDYGDCTGDFMKTNQSEYGNSDGSTIITYYVDGGAYTGTGGSDGVYGMRLFCESRGYDVFGYHTQLIQGHNGNTQGFTFDDYKAQINSGRPVMIQLSGHTVLGVGYDDAGQKIYLHNTWDYDLHEMNWGQTYAGLQHYAVSVVELLPLQNAILNVSPSNPTVTWEAGFQQFSITSNKNWSVNESVDWLSVQPPSGSGNGSFIVNYAENQMAQQRSANIGVMITSPAKASGDSPENTDTDFLIWEDFSDNIIPVAWQAHGLGTTNWRIVDAALAGSPPPMLQLNWEPQFVGLARMVLPTINTTGAEKLNLVFKHFASHYSNSFTVGVAVSNDAGQSWQTLWSVPVSSNVGPETIEMEIDEPFAGSELFRLSFFFQGDSWDMWDWNLDNILLVDEITGINFTFIQEAHPFSNQIISLDAGWSGISSNIQPASASVEQLLSPLGANFIILKNLAEVYWPGGNVNTIVNWDSFDGYVIKVGQDAELIMSGIQITQKSVPLIQGWNLIPVLSTQNVTVSQIFGPVLPALQVVKDAVGTGIFWPGMNINTLQVLRPGKSYWVKMSAPGTVTFP